LLVAVHNDLDDLIWIVRAEDELEVLLRDLSARQRRIADPVDQPLPVILADRMTGK